MPRLSRRRHGAAHAGPRPRSGAARGGGGTVLFASSNKNKFSEASDILAEFGIGVKFFRCRMEEIQSDSLAEIAARKSAAAAAACAGGLHVIAEDDGLFIDALGGFPGPYSAYVHGTIGPRAVARLLPRGAARTASFRSAVAYSGPRTQAGAAARGGRGRVRQGQAVHAAGSAAVFEGRVNGTIAARPRGDGWGYDPVFVPAGRRSTFAQMAAAGSRGTGASKNDMSHRRAALERFAAWFVTGGRR